jgi:hypothetical protein
LGESPLKLRRITASRKGRSAMSAGTMQPQLASRQTAAMLRSTVDLPAGRAKQGYRECVKWY